TTERIDSSPVLAFDANSLRGRVAVVTGAAGGLGRAISHRLGGMGATIVMVDRVPVSTPACFTNAVSKPCDISQPDAMETVAKEVIEEFGHCDILINNAGIKTPPVPLEELPLEEWDSVFAVNVRAAF